MLLQRLLNNAKNHLLALSILAGVIIGALIGLRFRQQVILLKPLGDIFLNLLITSVTPLVFFVISSSLAATSNIAELRRILVSMMVIFVITGIIASLLMLAIVTHYLPPLSISLTQQAAPALKQLSLANAIASSIAPTSFYQLLDKGHMLAMIIFSCIVGIAIASSGDKGKPLLAFLQSAKVVMLQVIKIIMLYAPIGLGAYVAYLVGMFGPKLFTDYGRIMLLYYPVTILYFLLAFTAYAYIAAGFSGVKRFWKNSLNPTIISFLTGSSNATIPANLKAAEAIGVPKQIREVVIPIGATMHMDGSCLAAILKIAVLFSVFGIDLSGSSTLMLVLAVALLSGIVMSGVTDGGFVGETLIISLLGFPAAAFPIIAMIGVLVDPPATTINAVGDTVASMLVSRWLKKTTTDQRS